MKILLTGSSGTIGTRLFEELKENSTHEIVGVDKRRNKWHRAIDLGTIQSDLRYPEEVEQLPGGFDLIIHFAANARVYELVQEPTLAFDNMLINFNVLEYARNKNVPRIIFASSREIYGNIMQDKPVCEDDMRIENCESAYGASKLVGEALLHAYQKSYGVDFVIVRFSNVYGMYDDSDRVVPLWISQCLRNEPLTVFGQGKSLDFNYIDDTVSGVIRIIDRFDEVKGNAFNIAYGREICLQEVAEKIQNLFKASGKIIVKESRIGEVWRFEADISKSRELLGYKPEVNINEGLKRTVEWYNKAYFKYPTGN